MNYRHGFVVAAALLVACQSAPTTMYTLVVVAPADGAVRATYAGPPMRIDAVHLPPALDRVEVVINLAPGQLKLDDQAHWAAPLSQVARQTLSADMVARLPEGRVVFPHLTKPNGALGISVDLLDFQSDRNGSYIQASWTTAVSGDTAGITGGTVLLRTTQSGADPAGTARALSTLLGQLADRIVAAL